MDKGPGNTPSPYRFVFPDQKKKGKASSSSKSQFAAPPRFVSSTPRTHTQPSFKTPTQPFGTPASGSSSIFRRSNKVEETIEDSEDSSEASESSSSQASLPTLQELIQSNKNNSDDDDAQNEFERPRTPKRRKVSSVQTQDTPIPLNFGSSARNKFILPPSSTADDPEVPVPFSPHRHRAKDFVPGGYAASVREWALRAVAGAVGGSNETEYAVIVRIRELRCAGGVILLRGTRMVGGQETQSGEGRFVLPQGELKTPDVGDFLGLKRPMWPVALDDQNEERWTMAADWKILKRLQG